MTAWILITLFDHDHFYKDHFDVDHIEFENLDSDHIEPEHFIFDFDHMFLLILF